MIEKTAASIDIGEKDSILKSYDNKRNGYGTL